MADLYSSTSLLHIFFITGVLGCGCAWLAGRAIALTWRPITMVVGAAVLMGLAVRFIHFALFEERLFAPTTVAGRNRNSVRGHASCLPAHPRVADGSTVLLALSNEKSIELACAARRALTTPALNSTKIARDLARRIGQQYCRFPAPRERSPLQGKPYETPKIYRSDVGRLHRTDGSRHDAKPGAGHHPRSLIVTGNEAACWVARIAPTRA